MVTLYVTLIINHRKTIDQVPESIRAKVIEELFNQGYDSDGNPLTGEE